MMRKIRLRTFDDWLKEQFRDPHFRKGYEREKRAVFLSYRILTLRQKLGLSQAVLARRMKTSQQAVARLESGEHTGFMMKTLEKVAEALGADLVVDLRQPKRKPAM